MSSIDTQRPSTEAPPGRLRRLIATHPVTAFSMMAFGLGWPLLFIRTTTHFASVPVGCAYTYVALLGSALAVTWAGGGRRAVVRFAALRGGAHTPAVHPRLDVGRSRRRCGGPGRRRTVLPLRHRRNPGGHRWKPARSRHSALRVQRVREAGVPRRLAVPSRTSPPQRRHRHRAAGASAQRCSKVT
jgi:hypothetical protein